MKSSASHQQRPSGASPVVVIVGGGISGLTAARKLLRATKKVRVVLLEASDRLGGRIRAAPDDFLPGNHVLDLGAEFLHGKGTLLSEMIEEYGCTEEWKSKITDSSLLQEIFITSHADGGPSPKPTQDGFYGMYYINKELVRYDDERVKPLNVALESMENRIDDAETSVSLGDVFYPQLESMAPELTALAIASYANTVACTDLNSVSLHVMLAFEQHWEENEIEGDYRIHSKIGMAGLVEKLSDELQSNDMFDVRLNWQVCQIQHDNEIVKVTSTSNEVIQADAVIVTVPPPMLSSIGLDLTDAKKEALQYIGFDTALKVVLKFKTQLWPSKLQSAVCADSTVPEMWFRHFASDGNHEQEDCYVAVGFFTSRLAERFLAKAGDESGRASTQRVTELVIRQLSEMFAVNESEFLDAHQDTLWFNFKDHPHIKGGYVFPKVGMRQEHLAILAAPQGRVFFAGEATNTQACCTVQAAMETGVRAATEVIEYLEEEQHSGT